MKERYVINATMQHLTDEVMLPGTFEFNPIEGELGTPECNILVGMMLVTDNPPGEVVGIIHEDGQEAVEAFCRTHAEHLKKFGLALPE